MEESPEKRNMTPDDISEAEMEELASRLAELLKKEMQEESERSGLTSR